MKKTKTIDLKGKEYSQVKDRLIEFRSANPRASIETKPEIIDGQILFKARIVKDKADECSADATGHAMGKMTGEKAFEKLETIAVGRALALLGYASNGEIASSEEIEEFEEWQKEKAEEREEEWKEKINNVSNLVELQKVWSSMPAEMKIKFNPIKEEKKKEYENKTVRE